MDEQTRPSRTTNYAKATKGSAHLALNFFDDRNEQQAKEAIEGAIGAAKGVKGAQVSVSKTPLLETMRELCAKHKIRPVGETDPGAFGDDKLLPGMREGSLR